MIWASTFARAMGNAPATAASSVAPALASSTSALPAARLQGALRCYTAPPGQGWGAQPTGMPAPAASGGRTTADDPSSLSGSGGGGGGGEADANSHPWPPCDEPFR